MPGTLKLVDLESLSRGRGRGNLKGKGWGRDRWCTVLYCTIVNMYCNIQIRLNNDYAEFMPRATRPV